MKSSKILFGPAGLGTPALEGLKSCKKLKLQAAEIEFTYGVRMNAATAKEIGAEAKKQGIRLSVHAPYYINLASKEKEKIQASKKRIIQSCDRANDLGATHVVFHPGFYQERDKEEVYQMIKKEIQELLKEIKKNKWTVEIAAETTGKATQFGDLDELLRLKKETGCNICVDFAHIYARAIGKIDYNEVFKKLKTLKHIHCHFSGIIYGQKGERSHKLLEKSFFAPLARAIKKYKPQSMTIICESPATIGDAVRMQKWFKQ